METPQSPPFLGVTLTGINDRRSFYEEGRYQTVCASCQRPGAFEVHHAIQKQRLRREGAPLHSPDDALRVCAGGATRCHERHTNHQGVLPLTCLRDENIAFAVRWLGAGPAYNYLTRYYTGEDPRVTAILEFT